MRKKIRITNSFIAKHLPKRNKSAHKGDSGRALIIGGSKGLYGAGILAALAATRAGAGYTHLMCDLNEFPWLKYPDFIVHPLRSNELKNRESYSVGIGPGMGINARGKTLLKKVSKNFQIATLDADGLSLLAGTSQKLPSSWLITPHEGELARLLHTTVKKVHANRLEHAMLAQEKFGCTVLLKGAETIIVDKERYCLFSPGTPALAKAGTGDVLLGIIAALRAQGLSSFEAAVCAAAIHGMCAKLWLKEGNDLIGLRPTDLVERITQAILNLR